MPESRKSYKCNYSNTESQNHKIIRIPQQNLENHENLSIPHKTDENYEIHKNHNQNQ